MYPPWGTPAKLTKSSDFVTGAWAMVFLDTADQPGALAYHDLTWEGLPLAKVFVKTTLDLNQVSPAASHELVEMLVDPAINMMTTGPDPKTMYAYESADPVETLTFDVNGIPMVTGDHLLALQVCLQRMRFLSHYEITAFRV